jgi:arginine/lysine/ornithine decarboxylase
VSSLQFINKEHFMKKFMAVFTGSPTSPNHAKWKALDDTARKQLEQAGMQAWGKWMQDNAKSLVEAGGPLSKTKRVSAQGVADISNNLSGFTIIQAESHEAAARMFLNHPHFAIFPGDAVEIMEILPIPGM